MAHNGLRLGDGGDFYSKVAAGNQSLTNIPQLADCGALNRQFLVGDVTRWFSCH